MSNFETSYDRLLSDWSRAAPGRGRLTLRDWCFVAGVVGASILASVLLTLFLRGPIIYEIQIAAAVPLAVFLPAAIFVARQRRRIHALNAHLHTLLRLDALTGLLSRRAFFAEVEQAAFPGVLLALDADKFKAVNDTWGHAAGDQVLKELAVRMGRSAPVDALIGRLGGEEFAIYLPSASLNAGEMLAEAVRDTVSATPVLHGGVSIDCTISVGVAEVQSLDRIDYALEGADRALYMAKAGGRNRTCMAVPDRAGAAMSVRMPGRGKARAPNELISPERRPGAS